jgi:hypothetical protein
MVKGEDFQFEADFMEDGLRCIPMAARLRLDLCGVKLRLSEWSKMTDTEKTIVTCWPSDRAGAIETCREYLKALVLERTDKEATMIETEENPVWTDISSVPGVVQQKMIEFDWELPLGEWQAFTELQRFALIKLTRPGHENRNFPRAVLEFRQRRLIAVL